MASINVSSLPLDISSLNPVDLEGLLISLKFDASIAAKHRVQCQIFLVKYNFSLLTVISFHHGGLFCFICTELKHFQTFIQGPVNNLASHLRNIHNLRTSSNKVSGIPLVCSQNGCEETFCIFLTSVITYKNV